MITGPDRDGHNTGRVWTNGGSQRTDYLSLIGITIASDWKFALVLPEGGGQSLRLREGQD